MVAEQYAWLVVVAVASSLVLGFTFGFLFAQYRDSRQDNSGPREAVRN